VDASLEELKSLFLDLLFKYQCIRTQINLASKFQGDVYDDSRTIDLGADGKERPIETDTDVATRLISLEDDPTLPAFTFRLSFLGHGLSCFGAVLGQIFYF